MEVSEYLKYRKDLLDESRDEDGFTSEPSFISLVLPSMLEAKLIDSEECNESYYKYDTEKLKVNGYLVNESGERLQLFVLNEDSINITQTDDDLRISQKSYYDSQFNRATKFLNKAIKRHLDDEIQDSSPVKALISQISSSHGIDQFDVVEIFLISATATVTTRGNITQPKRFEFDEDTLKISFTKNSEQVQKEILIIKRLIDLNFLYSVLISQGNREPLTIDFRNFTDKIEVIKAADEENFESYLCVLPAKVLSELYKKHSSRLLEKNVRSFLQFRGVNQGIRETIRLNPEKFIAYNNGITITSTGKEIEELNGKIYLKSLTDFQIVNGGQTTASIYFTNKDGFNIDKVKVMAKINVAKNVSEENLDDLISKISQYSNSQSKVSNVDLRSRNPQLTKLKILSESIITPTGRKWFFEKSKGDFNTKLRIAGSAKSRIEKEYPKQNRFSKEELGKYFTAWGDHPYIVKKGGEKVFRYFIEELGGEGNDKKPVDINRNFFETLVAKIILFRDLEKIYGQGKNSMGQIRSAVIPYSISILYKYFDGSKGDKAFDLYKIWNTEGLGNDLTQYMTNLMLLINELIKKYSQSDDLGEYSKKKELWDDISTSKEIIDFLSSEDSKLIFEKYSISKKELEKKLKPNSKNKEVDFKLLKDNITIHCKTSEFYKKINSLLWENLTDNERTKLSNINALIQQKDNLTSDLISFEETLIQKIRINQPEIFDKINYDENQLLEETFNYIVKKYNSSISKSENIITSFERIGAIAKHKGSKYDSVFSEIGKTLNDGFSPTTKQIYYASYYVATINKSI